MRMHARRCSRPTRGARLTTGAALAATPRISRPLRAFTAARSSVLTKPARGDGGAVRARAGGHLEDAAQIAMRARTLSPDASPLRASADCQARREPLTTRPLRRRDAGVSQPRSIMAGRAGLLPVAQAALHRRIAIAWLDQGSAGHQRTSSRTATPRAVHRAGRPGDATTARIEAATCSSPANSTSASVGAIEGARRRRQPRSAWRVSSCSTARSASPRAIAIARSSTPARRASSRSRATPC